MRKRRGQKLRYWKKRRRSYPRSASSKPIELSVGSGFDNGSLRTLETSFGSQRDTPTRNSSQRQLRKGNLKGRSRKWSQSTTGSSGRSSRNRNHNGYRHTNPGITLLSSLQELQSHYERRSTRCRQWNKRNWISLSRRTYGKGTFGPPSRPWLR